jgi:hypothetical protein
MALAEAELTLAGFAGLISAGCTFCTSLTPLPMSLRTLVFKLSMPGWHQRTPEVLNCCTWRRLRFALVS